MKIRLLYVLLLVQLLACNKTSKEVASLPNDKEQTPSDKKQNLTSFYVGSYTDADSEGIYRYAIDTSGQLFNLGLVAKADNPSFLTRSKNGKYILAASEINIDGTGFVSSFTESGDGLIMIDSAMSAGAHPCYLTTNEQGYVLTANYSGGNIALHRINQNGELSDVLDVQQHQGSGTHIRQDKPHAHSCRFVAGTHKIIAVDLGTNELWFSELDTVNHLISDDVTRLAMADQAGPRHLEFHPNGDWIYVVNELNATITQISNNTGEYSIVSSINTLPEGYEEANKCADIHISADGKFLYASNRGHNSIVIYSVNPETGSLALVGHESTRGDAPRNFAISPDGMFILVANQNSDNIISFSRNPNTGLLNYTGEIKASKPVCILF